MLPAASDSAALQSIMPAPVRSRSSLTICAVISIASLLLSMRAGEVVAGPEHARSSVRCPAVHRADARTRSQLRRGRRRTRQASPARRLRARRSRRRRAARSARLPALVLVFEDLLPLGDAARSFVVRLGQPLRDEPDGADRVVVAGDDVVDQLRIASWCRRSRSPGCRACWPRRRRCTRSSGRPRRARRAGASMSRMPSRLRVILARSRSSRRRSFFDSMLSLSSSLPSTSLSRSTDAVMVTKLVSVPPSQRCVTQYWPQRCASSRIDVLRLALGADEQDACARRAPSCAHELGGLVEHLDRLLQIDDVDPVALAEDVRLHLRVPAPGLVPEVDARLEQLLHGDLGQRHLLLSLERHLALAELEAGAGAALAVLLALLLARVAGQEPGRLAERFAQLWIELGRARAMPWRIAPAWPAGPPPSTVTMMSNFSAFSVASSGCRITILSTSLGK